MRYGFTDAINKCADRGFNHEPVEPCSNPETHFFYHDGHPSTAAHRAVGEMLYREAITKAP
ncbi:MAG TPA: hypothetical protein VGL53_31920 [Bryobacteraceae bacterium]